MAIDIDAQYRMTISLHVLEELGINLYSNIPAVLAEVVANSWDADAQTVRIDINRNRGQIVITDDGRGMLVNDEINEINDKYLTVGYHRRDEQSLDSSIRDGQGNLLTPKFKRPLMGRKGIGKLSLFGIANEFEVHTARKGFKAGCVMSTEDIRRQIETGSGVYEPRAIDPSSVEVEKGTRIILSDLKKDLRQSARNLRRRLARRFGIKGAKYDFEMLIDGTEVAVDDRDYFHKVQYLWEYGDSSPSFSSHCRRLEKVQNRSGLVNAEYDFRISGWIGTSHRSGDLKEGNESINKIVVMVREKLAQEDVLDKFGEGGVYASYVFGEIHADFLDMDEWDDIATSSRQQIIEDDVRYTMLKDFIGQELKEVQRVWRGLRREKGARIAKSIPAIDRWFQSLGLDQKRKAQAMFGKINQLNLQDDQRKILLQNGVIAFETLRHKEQLDRLDNLTANDMETIAKIFYDLDDFEATLYHRIVDERLRVVKALKRSVDDNALERVLQEHIFSHLWLLDPSWERATATTPYLETTIKGMFEDVEGRLTQAERDSRVDIKYTTAQGKHVIVELK